MRVLLTNDDGVYAEGLTVLEGIARALRTILGRGAGARPVGRVSRSALAQRSVAAAQFGPRRFAVKGRRPIA